MFVKIIDDVRSYFTAIGVTATVDDGAGAHEAQTNYDELAGANRVVFTTLPNVGVSEPTFIGGEPRQLLDLLYAFSVSFAGFDPNNPERDLAHQHVCVDLFEKVAQAVNRSYFGAYEWSDVKWTTDRKYGRFGAELVATLTLNIPISDAADVDVAPVKPKPGAPKPPPP